MGHTNMLTRCQPGHVVTLPCLRVSKAGSGRGSLIRVGLPQAAQAAAPKQFRGVFWILLSNLPLTLL